MRSSALIRIFGFPATLLHGDTLVLDRWRWITRRLPKTNNGEILIDIGCGSGAFTIGAARRGYHALGLSWDEEDQRLAAERARLCGADGKARFKIQDVRHLDERDDFTGKFDVAICAENIEHIIDDRKLMADIFRCLKPGGQLLLTTPHYYYKAISEADNGPFAHVEDGSHVRRGYNRAMLMELCAATGFQLDEVSFCSGMVSQKVTKAIRALGHIHPLLAWGLTLPLRILPPLLDWPVTVLLNYPYFSICLIAVKPRFLNHVNNF